MLPNANIQEELALALVRMNSLFSISVLQLDKVLRMCTQWHIFTSLNASPLL